MDEQVCQAQPGGTSQAAEGDAGEGDPFGVPWIPIQGCPHPTAVCDAGG